jgi:aminoglycoside/choline kinase family phosphotransferase
VRRIEQIKIWLKDELAIQDFEMTSASSDASFRRYFRITPTGTAQGIFKEHASLIVMDAPPEQEDTRPFIDMSQRLSAIDLNVPIIKSQNLAQGFLLITDLGQCQYLEVLNSANVKDLYADALNALLKIQQFASKQSGSLPAYNVELLMQEMELFRHWYLSEHLGIVLTEKQNSVLQETFEFLADTALEQPTVCVHRDYHSRNLMLTDKNNPGILDFQDAVLGPVTYDLVSLLRDCYIDWPRKDVEAWAKDYMKRACEVGIISDYSDSKVLRWFDLMGIQRHLKATGIFARLNKRDGKPGYLQDIPRTMAYVLDVSEGYPELDTFRHLVNSLNPALGAK